MQGCEHVVIILYIFYVFMGNFKDVIIIDFPESRVYAVITPSL